MAFRELLKLSPEILTEADSNCIFIEVTVGRRRAGSMVIWPLGKGGYEAAAIPNETSPDPPDLWINDERGSDLDGLALWFACDVEDIDFGPVYEETLDLRKRGRAWVRAELSERYGWMCHICGSPIPRRLRAASYTIARPDPQFPDIEHVVPLSRGGVHYFGNSRLAHHDCNLRKAARDPVVAPPLLRARMKRPGLAAD